MGRRVLKSKAHSARRVGKVLYGIVVALSAVVVLLYCLFLYLNRPPEHQPPTGSKDISAGVSVPTPNPLDPDSSAAPEPEGRAWRTYTYTFLLVATDQVSGSTDTMMVLTYDTEIGRAHV